MEEVNDPFNLTSRRREDVTKEQIKNDYPQGDARLLRKFYTRQNKLIDQFLGIDDEERAQAEEEARVAGKIKFAVNASFVVNFCLFVIQLYAAISTGSLALFATAADAFMDLVSSFVMLITSWLAARPSIYKYPVSQFAIADGVLVFSKASLMLYCMTYRKYPSVHVFFIDHRNDIAVNSFGLIMSVVGDKFIWYLDPIGAICIALLILFSWISNAFEQIWLLVGKAAPQEFIAKLIYMSITHDDQISMVETVDIVMDEETSLKISHDVAQSLQRKIEGLGDVERAFVHVDYECEHSIHEEHKPLYDRKL
ncbi:hypothetical protein IWW34DRAFT_621511 [Fusarium oxysporum f. sp. albedinis]|nr:hypothetical protein IWW34DRAFT_621511 [Fusarium oxysporum f. sp. albedinis]